MRVYISYGYRYLHIVARQIVRKKAIFAAYFLYKRSGTIPVERIESMLQQALEDKDSSVVFSALSIWKLVLGVVYLW